MARPIPHDVSPSLGAYLRELASASEAGSRIGVSWRLREGPYPDADSPVCLLVQVADGSGWKTAAAFDPSGNLVAAGPPPLGSEPRTSYVVSGFFPGAYTADQRILYLILPGGLTFEAGLAGAKATLQAIAGTPTFWIQFYRSGLVASGSFQMLAGNNAAFSFLTAFTTQDGDRLAIVAPTPADPGVQGLSVALPFTRSL